GAHGVRRPRRSGAHRAGPHRRRPGRDRADARPPGHRDAGARGNPAGSRPDHPPADRVPPRRRRRRASPGRARVDRGPVQPGPEVPPKPDPSRAAAVADRVVRPGDARRAGPRLRLALGTLPPLTERDVTVPGRVTLPEIGRALEATFHDAEAFVISDDPGRVAFDADLLPATFVVRPRRSGDRFTPFGGVERKLKDFLIDAKVPRWERDRVPIVEAAGEIVWLGGLRR